MAKRIIKNKKNSRQPKPLKLATLVVSAIEELKESKGATPRKIVGYLTYATQLPVAKIKRQVNSLYKSLYSNFALRYIFFFLVFFSEKFCQF